MRKLILKVVAYFLFIRPSNNRSYADYEKLLADNGITIEQYVNRAADHPKNRQQLRHIIGIERWSCRRLMVCFGEPFIREEYDGYAPAADQSWSQLLVDFKATRQATIALAQRFAREQPANAIVEHDDFGPMEAKIWLQYLYSHAEREAKGIR